MNGVIKRLESDKGYGFIDAPPDYTSVFFHHSCVNARFEQLHEGQAVAFELDVDKGKGPRARSVTV